MLLLLVLLLGGSCRARRTVAWLRGVLLWVELSFLQCAPRGLCMVAVMERRKYGIARALLARAFRVALRVGSWARVKWLNGNMHAVLGTLHCVLATGLARRRALCRT